MKGMRRAQQPCTDAIGLEPYAERLDLRRLAGDDATHRTVVGRNRQARRQARLEVLCRQPHRQHRTRRQRLHQPAATRHQPRRIGHRHHARQRRADEFADAVAYHRGRLQTVGHPHASERVFDGERGRLGDGRRREVGLGAAAFCPEQYAVQVDAFRPQRLGALVEGVAERLIGRVQRATHAGILRALAGEHVDDLRRAGVDLALRQPCVAIEQQPRRRLSGLGDDKRAVRERTAPDTQRVRDVDQWQKWRVGEVPTEALDRGIEGGRAARRDRQQFGADSEGARGRQRRFLQHDVGVGAANPERADAGAPRNGAALPIARLGLQVERRGREIDPRARLRRVQRGRQAFLGQRQCRLDHARGACRDDQVADVALERADRAIAGSIRTAAKGARQSLDLDRVPDRSGRAVRLDVADRLWADAGHLQRRSNDGRLSGGARRGETRLLAAIVVDGGAAQHREDRVAIGEGIREPLQHDDRGAVAEHRAPRLVRETARATVRGEHRALLVQVAAAVRIGDRNTARDGHVAMAIAQRVEGLRNRHQRGRTRGVETHRRTRQAQLECRARRQVILLVKQREVELAVLVGEPRLRQQVLLQVAAVILTGEHADAAVEPLRHVARTLQGLPAQFEKDPLLRIHQLGLARTDAEEARVEQVNVVEDAARAHIRRVVAQGARDARVELLVTEIADRFPALDQVAPERFHIGRARETPGHRDQRYWLGARGRRRAHTPQRPAGHRPRVTLAGHDRGRCRLAEERRRRQPRQAPGLQARQRAHHEQRTAPEFEEVVEATHAVDPQDLGKHAADLQLRGIDRRDEILRELGAMATRRGQREAVGLLVRQQWYRFESHQMGRDHVVRQPLREKRAQLALGHGRVAMHHIGHQSRVAGHVLANDRHGL